MSDAVTVELLGRAEFDRARNNPAGQYYAPLASTTSNASLLPLTVSIASRESCRGRDGVFMIATNLIAAAVRVNPLPQPALTYNEIMNSAPAFVSPIVPVRLLVDAQRAAGRHLVLCDLGQPFEIIASSITLSLIGPTGFGQVFPSGQGPAASAGVVFDFLLGCAVAEIEAPIGEARPILTSYHAIPANTAVTIPIPACASEVQLSQTLAGAAIAACELHVGDPATGSIQIGSVPFANRISIPGSSIAGATCLRTDVDAANARFVTARWTIQP